MENRVGANGHIGNRLTMEAKPDGYTITITGNSSYVGNPLLMKDATYDPVTALQSIATLTDVGLILVVDAKSDIKTVADLTARLNAKKGDAKYAAAFFSRSLSALSRSTSARRRRSSSSAGEGLPWPGTAAIAAMRWPSLGTGIGVA